MCQVKDLRSNQALVLFRREREKMISVNDCDTPMTASGQFDVENKYDLVMIKDSEIQKATETTPTSSQPVQAETVQESHVTVSPPIV